MMIFYIEVISQISLHKKSFLVEDRPKDVVRQLFKLRAAVVGAADFQLSIFQETENAPGPPGILDLGIAPAPLELCHLEDHSPRTSSVLDEDNNVLVLVRIIIVRPADEEIPSDEILSRVAAQLRDLIVDPLQGRRAGVFRGLRLNGYEGPI